MTGTLTYFQCPTCGAALPPEIKDRGSTRCLFCDVVSFYEDNRVALATRRRPTGRQRLVGALKRFGTLLAAPLMGWSAVTVLNIQRIFASSEEPVAFTLIISAAVLAQMLLGRWLVAGVWTLFTVLALVFERVVAAQVVYPHGHFSLGAEVSLLPLSISLGFVVFFSLFYWKISLERRQHEQRKFSWRSSVMALFLFGVILGMQHYAKPTTREVCEAWSWSYAIEMFGLSELSRQLELAPEASGTAMPTGPLRSCRKAPRDGCNLVFISRAALDSLPNAGTLSSIASERHLWLHGPYVRHLSEMAVLSRGARSHHHPIIAEAGWKADANVYRAPWMLVYDHDATGGRLRAWLVSKPYPDYTGQLNDLVPSPPRVVAYREAPWAQLTRDLKREGDWVLKAAAAMAAGAAD